jgi:hypothetical protein
LDKASPEPAQHKPTPKILQIIDRPHPFLVVVATLTRGHCPEGLPQYILRPNTVILSIHPGKCGEPHF